MSAPYVPNQVNPPGQGLVFDENFTVARQSPTGQLVQRTPGANAGFYNYANDIQNSPLDYIDAVIRREDFPPGPEGGAQYEAALTSMMSSPAMMTTGFDEQGNPVRSQMPGGTTSAGRTGTQQNVFDANEASRRSSQGGSSSLATISWATNHPEEALSALMAMDSGAITDPNQWLDDATIRDIVTGLGGPDAVNQMIAAERDRLFAEGTITATGQNSTGEQWAAQHDISVPGIGDFNYMGSGQWLGPDGLIYTMKDDGNLGLDTGYTSPGDPSSGPGIVQGQAGPVAPGSPPKSDMRMQAPPNAQPTNAYDPYQMGQNGEIVGSEPLPDGYTYTQVGKDTYLDVTSPAGQVHRFTGDVVEAVYTGAGVTSFDELVARYGYQEAVGMLFDFINPPQPQQPQAAPPAASPGAGAPPPQAGPAAPAAPPPAPPSVVGPGPGVPSTGGPIPPGQDFAPPTGPPQQGMVWDPVNGVWIWPALGGGTGGGGGPSGLTP